MSLKYKISLFMSSIIMLTYFSIQSMLVFEAIECSKYFLILGFVCFLSFIPFFGIVINEILVQNKKNKHLSRYRKNLNNILISQTHNRLFHEGKLIEASKDLTKNVVESLKAGRCSIWTYNKDKTSIICQQLYSSIDYTWSKGFELIKDDYKPYFDALIENPIIVANNAEKHPSTSCFTESYLKPLGIVSMLDVPIIHKNQVIGVICIESFIKKEWCEAEIEFAQMLSSLYSFAYSVKENNNQVVKIREMEKFMDEAALISKADPIGNITYVNKKFIDVSGFTLEEALGKNLLDENRN